MTGSPQGRDPGGAAAGLGKRLGAYVVAIALCELAGVLAAIFSLNR